MTRPTMYPYLYAAAVAAAVDVPESDREGVTPEAAVFGRLADLTASSYAVPEPFASIYPYEAGIRDLIRTHLGVKASLMRTRPGENPPTAVALSMAPDKRGRWFWPTVNVATLGDREVGTNAAKQVLASVSPEGTVTIDPDGHFSDLPTT